MITITQSGNTCIVSGNTDIIRLILSSALTDINAFAMSKGSADYHTLYSELSLALSNAAPWPLAGKIGNPDDLLRQIRGDKHQYASSLDLDDPCRTKLSGADDPMRVELNADEHAARTATAETLDLDDLL